MLGVWNQKQPDHVFGCSAIVYEVESLRETVNPLFRNVLKPGELMPRLVPAETHGQNKYGRAASVAPLINSDPARVFFAGVFPGLELQMCTFDGRGRRSPDRLDALVYGLRYLTGSTAKRYMIDYGIA